MPSFEEREKARKRARAMRYSHYKEGKSYDVIAKEYGISRQRVHQIVNYNHKSVKECQRYMIALEKIVFPKVVDYCIENNLNTSSLITICGATNYNEQMRMRDYLTGRIKPKYKYAKAVSDVTGISIEELMGDEIKCSK